MLRLPRFELRQPTSVAEAARMLADLGPDALVLAGGTDLLPNMKHELFTPAVVVSLGRIDALRGIRAEADGSLRIGAMTTIADVAHSPIVAERAPCLAQAAGLIAGPQLRRAGTIGGNVLLDTRCQYYNQSYFWRSALGYCLKKDGTVCHVVAGASRCVAAAAADTAPALMTLCATLEFERAAGQRAVAIDDFWVADGISNRRILPGEILVSIRIPPTPPGHRGAYGKLRERGSIDFPLLGVAARLDIDAGGLVERADLVLTALAARPRRVSEASTRLCGTQPGTPGFDMAVQAVAESARRHCHTLSNLLGDTAWRQDMIPVYVKRTLQAAAAGGGPVHHL
ncbi:MAG: FAD binding domain-containing protein [Acidobacteriota bacterium]